MKKLILIIIVTAVSGGPLPAQQLTLGLFQGSTDNLFQTAYPEQDQVSQLSFSLTKDFRPVSFFTEGAYSHLYRNPTVSNFSQELGLDFVHALNGKTALYAAVKAGGALYRSDYHDFNHFTLGFLGAIKSYLSGSSILKANYAFDYRKYGDPAFDFSSHLANFSLDRYFQTRTTLKAEINWGLKHFLHPFDPSDTEPVEPEPPVNGHPGHGGGHGPGGGQMGWRDGISKLGPPDLGQTMQVLSLGGLVAQGLGNNLGLRVSGTRQWTVSGENPFVSISEFYMVENPTYDVFSWNGYVFSGQLTFEAPWNTQLKLGYTGFRKEFPGIEAMNLEGEPLDLLRQDKRNQWEARLEKNFSRLSFYIHYSYVINHSNDALFEWQGHFLSVGVDWRLTWGDTR